MISFLKTVLIILVATWYHLGASQDIILKVVEPDPISQQSLCPNQRVVYKCGVVVTSFELSWTLVDKCSLKFTALSNTSDTDSKCDGKFNATLTHKRDISDDQTDGYLFNSTLEIFPPLSNSNGSVLMCTGGTVSKQVKDNATITLSGKPDPPTDLSYSLLESSVELKWNRPSYTGGNKILGMMYNVTANGKTYPVQNGSVAVKYTSPDLIHGDIKVTAINQCEQESMPAIVKIPTAAPPEPTLQLPVLYCDDTLSGGRRVDIKWMYGEMKEGVVYPGEVRVGLSLDSQAEGCSDVLEDATNCTAVITRDDIMYTINLTLSNDVAQTHPVMKMFESRPLKNETQPSSEGLIVTLTVSETCRNAKYSLLVSFGARDSNGNYDSRKNLMMTSRNVVPGKPYSFKVDASVLQLESGQVYCYNGSLLGSEGILYVASGCAEHKSSGLGLSGAQIAGITLGTLVCVVLLALGVVAVVSIVLHFFHQKSSKDVPLIPSNVMRAVREVEEWWGGISDNVLAGWLFIPQSKQDEIKRKFPDEMDQKRQAISYWINIDPLASWRRLITQLDEMRETEVADSIRSNAEPLTDASLTPHTLLHAVSTVRQFWEYGRDGDGLLEYLGVPESVICQIRDSQSYSSEDEKRMAGLQYCLQTVPGVSWGRIAGVLWYLEEHTALETVRQYLPPKHDPSLSPSNLTSALDSLPNTLWWGFGERMNVPESTLDKIESQFHTDMERKTEVLRVCSTEHPQPTWEQVSDALYQLSDEKSHSVLERVKSQFPTEPTFSYSYSYASSRQDSEQTDVSSCEHKQGGNDSSQQPQPVSSDLNTPDGKSGHRLGDNKSHSGKSCWSKHHKKSHMYSSDPLTKISLGREPITPNVVIGQL